MTEHHGHPRNCIIWFGNPSSHERETLAAAGWGLRIARLDTGTAIGLRGDDTVVGVIDLRHEADPVVVADLLDAHSHLQLMAIMPRTPLDGTLHRHLVHTCADTLQAPLDPTRLVAHLQGLASGTAPGRTAASAKPDTLFGQSPAICTALACIHKYAPVELPVLITGETGTGKEVAARVLHRLSPRSNKPFIAVNCAALPASLIQSELFGHERGAFTGAAGKRLGLFESADGGTVFLDEIGDLPLDVQTNLLRVLQEGTLERIGSHQPVRIDVRIFAATHVDLEQAVEHGHFRRDLYYRLNVLRLHLPRLTERGDDIEPLAQHFLDEFRRKNGGRARGFSPEAKRALHAFDWPGNVRELLNRIQRAAVVAEHEWLSPTDLELPLDAAPGPNLLGSARRSAERETILSCLRDSGFNISECARRLKISRITVYRLCKKHDLALHELR